VKLLGRMGFERSVYIMPPSPKTLVTEPIGILIGLSINSVSKSTRDIREYVVFVTTPPEEWTSPPTTSLRRPIENPSNCA
jgi:hypothetical protein